MGHFFYRDQEFVLKRIVSASGRSRSFLNDDPITTARLAELGDTLINIYGQNEFQYLLEKENYIGILDSLLSLNDEREALAEKVQALKKCESELSAKKRESEGREKEIALLDFQIEEIERAAVQVGEEDRVKERLKILRDAEKIQLSLNAISDGLYEGEESSHLLMKRFVGLLRRFMALMPCKSCLKGLSPSLMTWRTSFYKPECAPLKIRQADIQNNRADFDCQSVNPV